MQFIIQKNTTTEQFGNVKSVCWQIDQPYVEWCFQIRTFHDRAQALSQRFLILILLKLFGDSVKGAMAPVAISIGVWQMYIRVGNATFAALGTLLFLNILGSICGYYIGKVRQKIAKQADERIKILEETINAILVIKMYCWERFLLKKINDRRTRLHL